jgi:hypothetical protein
LGRPLPDWYLDAPETIPTDQVYLSAFSDLGTERRYEGGPIPLSDIKKYALEDLNLDEEMVHIFTTTIREMDMVYLDWLSKKRHEKVSRPQKDSPAKKSIGSTATRTRK